MIGKQNNSKVSGSNKNKRFKQDSLKAKMGKVVYA